MWLDRLFATGHAHRVSIVFPPPLFGSSTAWRRGSDLVCPSLRFPAPFIGIPSILRGERMMRARRFMSDTVEGWCLGSCCAWRCGWTYLEMRGEPSQHGHVFFDGFFLLGCHVGCFAMDVTRVFRFLRQVWVGWWRRHRPFLGTRRGVAVRMVPIDPTCEKVGYVSKGMGCRTQERRGSTPFLTRFSF